MSLYAVAYLMVAYLALVAIWSVDDSGPLWFDLAFAALWPIGLVLAIGVTWHDSRSSSSREG